jgi:enamine deaminase RidA (YjgF/YER057c/UK114 family)
MGRNDMIVEKLTSLGYEFTPARLQHRAFHVAVRSGTLVFTSGQGPVLGDVVYEGKVGEDVSVESAQKAAEICAFNCLRAVGAVVDIESVTRVVKVFGMVNVATGFSDTATVINGATEFLNAIFGDDNTHARSAVGMTLPNNWAVEVEIVVECTA